MFYGVGLSLAIIAGLIYRYSLAQICNKSKATKLWVAILFYIRAPFLMTQNKAHSTSRIAILIINLSYLEILLW